MNDINISINIGCHYLEKLANMGACIPVYGTSIIACRLFGGVIQTVLSVFTRIVGAFAENINKVYQKKIEQRKWREINEMAFEHMKHGLLNICVAICQLIVGFFSFNLGNAFIYLHKGNFESYVPYKGIVAANSYTKTPISYRKATPGGGSASGSTTYIHRGSRMSSAEANARDAAVAYRMSSDYAHARKDEWKSQIKECR